MRTVYLCSVVVFIVSLSACTGTRVVIAPDSTLDPGTHQTFAWFSIPIQSSGRNDFYYHLDRSLRTAVTRELISRGYRQVAKEQADFIVGYRFFATVSEDKGGIISPRDEMQAVWDNSIKVNNTALYNHPVPAAITHGSLELTLDNAQSGKALWKAMATKVIENNQGGAESINNVVDNVVPKLVKGLPDRH